MASIHMITRDIKNGFPSKASLTTANHVGITQN